MDRKGILGMIVAVLAFAGWQVYYERANSRATEARKAAAAKQAAEQPVQQEAVVPVARPEGVSAPAPAASQPVEKAVAELHRVVTAQAEYEFTSLGGGLASVKLLGHSVDRGAAVRMNEFSQVPIGALSEVAGEATDMPHKLSVDSGSGEVRFERTDARGLEIQKRFSLPSEEARVKDPLSTGYTVRLEVAMTNRSAQPVAVTGYFVHTGSLASLHRSDMPNYTGYHVYSREGGKSVDATWFDGGGWFSRRPASTTYNEGLDRIRWVGVTNQYFNTLITAEVDEKAVSKVQATQFGAQAWARRAVVSDAAWQEAGHSMEGKSGTPLYAVDGALGMPGRTLQPGESFTQGFTIYSGPREYRRLDAQGQEQGDIMNLGWFGIVSRVLLGSMNVLSGWFGSYAWAIIVLTVIIKLMLWPLQNKATKSMKMMAALQPKMTELREKYAADPSRLNMEVMQLYKEYQINPLGGCLPMVVQIPIFFGFYNMLGKAVELRNSRFLWVEDLSQPDTVAHLLGMPVNVLPLCMAVTMLVQMRIQPKSGDPAQQRIFMFMPLIFIFFCYNFASALALYWTVQNLFSIAQLSMTRGQAAPVLERVSVRKKSKR